MFNKEVIKSGDKLYIVLRKVHIEHKPIVETWKEHLNADRVFRKEPYFYLNTEIFSEIDKSNSDLAVMAVDNLPSELPRDSSTEFGNGIVNEVIPYILGKDDGRILNSTITDKGRFLEKYNYLNDYINS